MEDFLELIPFAKGLNVMFVEDNDEVQMQTKKMLNNIFNNIKVASNGLDALELYKKDSSVDIIITDISMPKMDGKELCENIFKINKEQMVVVISAYSNSEAIESLLKLGVYKYIQKPIDNKKLIESFSDVLKKLK